MVMYADTSIETVLSITMGRVNDDVNKGVLWLCIIDNSLLAFSHYPTGILTSITCLRVLGKSYLRDFKRNIEKIYLKKGI